MGYDVRITRKETWWDESDLVIDEDEWADVVDSDDELEWDERRSPFDVLWKGEAGAAFWYRSGSIVTKNPRREDLVKMYEIAVKLGAVVQGDQGERYDEEGNQVGWVEPEDLPQALAKSESGLISFIKRLFGNH